ncbi:MAG: GyrI-like domain-containing protein [Methanomassiliicoccales archaeon]|nr:GyrI-like domain-containing protein [Methanomassiliicoccales archaeon]
MTMTEFEIIDTKAQEAIAIRERVRVKDIPQVMGRMFGEIVPLLNGEVQCCGPPFTFYHSWSGDETDMEVGFPVSGKGISKGRVRPFVLPAGKAVMAMHTGPYEKLVDTYNKMMEWMKVKGLQPADHMWEEYLNGPDDTPMDKLMTKLIWPIR